MMKKYIALVAVGIFACSTIFAQSKHEVSFYGAGGLSTLKYSLDQGKQKNKIGGSFGVGYNYYIHSNWSLATGVEFSFYNSKSSLDNLTDMYEAKDGVDNMLFRSKISGYNETQNVGLINIPIMVQFEQNITEAHKFYASGGFKIGIPAKKKFTVKDATYNNSGYYSQWDVELDEQEFVGFGEFKHSKTKGDLDIKTSFLLSLETGMKWQLTPCTYLYTGVYFDYGLNDINKSPGKRMTEYNAMNPHDFVSNSMMSSVYGDHKSTRKFVDKVHPMAVGLKIRFAFSLD